ncbi:MAG: hypothetical protein HC907_39105, partial [Richelia sp. SM1_7_0]|nr:hypothetical protein [Richelia sp. SM1_7_0]
VLGYVISMGIIGWIEGNEWVAGNAVQGTMILRKPYNIARAISGLILIIGQLLFAFNVWKTVSAKPSLVSN